MNYYIINMTDLDLYKTDYLVDRLYNELEKQHINQQKVILDKPIVKIENKKTCVVNFNNICIKLNRATNDVKQYFEKEMNVVTSINAAGGLIITGMFRENQITKIFSSYIQDFVKCKECNSCDTEIIKENRITYNNCNKCKSKKAFL